MLSASNDVECIAFNGVCRVISRAYTVSGRSVSTLKMFLTECRRFFFLQLKHLIERGFMAKTKDIVPGLAGRNGKIILPRVGKMQRENIVSHIFE